MVNVDSTDENSRKSVPSAKCLPGQILRCEERISKSVGSESVNDDMTYRRPNPKTYFSGSSAFAPSPSINREGSKVSGWSTFLLINLRCCV